MAHSKADPWMLDKNEATKMKNETKFQSTGTICPKRNLSIGEPCKACDEVSKVYQTTVDGDPKRKAAGRQSAKASYFANVVFPSNTDTSVILEMGKMIGDKLLDQLEKGEWLDIAHPMKGMGRELRITKTKKPNERFPKYSIDPVLEKADWDIPKSVLDSLPNLDQANLIDIVKNETEEIFKVSSLKIDESITIRVCPTWAVARERGEKRILTPLFRHWGGVTEENVLNGGLDFGDPDEDQDATTEKAPWEDNTSSGSDEPSIDMDTPPVEQDTGSDREPCFGKANVYEQDDEECMSCRDYKGCGRAVLKAS